jgi:tetrahydromethanopterin S-methyltransferase subunit D
MELACQAAVVLYGLDGFHGVFGNLSLLLRQQQYAVISRHCLLNQFLIGTIELLVGRKIQVFGTLAAPSSSACCRTGSIA